MACFLVPVAEAIVTTIATKVIKSKETDNIGKAALSEGTAENAAKIKFSTQLGWLNKLLWGGSALLAFEHVWHGEVQPFFPFLTAAESADTLAEMFHEMGTVGVGMAAAVTIAWGVVTGISMYKERHKAEGKASNKVKAV